MFKTFNDLKTSINAALFGVPRPAETAARAKAPPRPRPILTKKDIARIQWKDNVQQFELSLIGWRRENGEYGLDSHIELLLVMNDLHGKRTYWLGDLIFNKEEQYIFHPGYNDLEGDTYTLAKDLLIGCHERFKCFKVVKDRYWPLTLFTTNHRRQDIMGLVPNVAEIVSKIPDGNKVLRNIIMGDPADHLKRGPFEVRSEYWLQTC